MAGADSSPLITSRADLIEAMARGAKPKSEWRVGTEHEKHVYRKDPLRPVHEELHAFAVGEFFKRLASARRRERLDDEFAFTRQVEAAPRGDQAAEPGGAFQEASDDLRRAARTGIARHQLLEVVQDQECGQVFDRPRDPT